MKTRFERWITRNDIWYKFDAPFLFNNTYGLPMLTKDTKFPNQVFYVCLDDLQNICNNRGWKRDPYQIMICVHVCSTWSLVEIKTRFETWIIWNYVNSVSKLHFSYLITLMAYLCSKGTPNVQIKYFMFDWYIQTICAK
jgi:hypothetical protein